MYLIILHSLNKTIYWVAITSFCLISSDFINWSKRSAQNNDDFGLILTYEDQGIDEEIVSYCMQSCHDNARHHKQDSQQGQHQQYPA